MLKEFVEKISEMTKASVLDFSDGRTMADKKLYPLGVAQPAPLLVNNLGGLVDYMKLAESTGLLVHVESHSEVSIVSRLESVYKSRGTYAVAQLPDRLNTFKAGHWYDLEEFVIAVQTNFTGHQVQDLLAIVGNVNSERVATSTDDGVTQQIGLRAGVTLKSTTPVRPYWDLNPWRTFPEVEQPVCRCLLRFRQSDDDLPRVSLWEADGDMWKVKAVQSIKQYFSEKFPGEVVI
jgi:hypothetical protein